MERRRLRRAGYETVLAASCEEAFRKVSEADVDLILLDQRLPDGTGLEFYERLKALGDSLPVIIVTGMSDDATVIEALRAGVRDFVTKSPEYLDYLPEAVERVLEQVRMEQRLKESEEKYRSIFENAVEGIYQASLDGRLLTANPAMARMFGYGSPEEMISAISDTTTQLWTSPEERCGYVRRLRKEGVVVGAEVLMNRKDGSTIWVSANVCVLRNAEGETVALEGTLEDISERKRAEKALWEQTDTLEKLNRIGRLLSSELDTHKLVQEVTDRATELTGAKFGAFFYNVTDDSGENYTLYTISGVLREAFSKFPMPRNTEVFGSTFRGEGVVRFDDVRKSAGYGKSLPYRGMPEGHLPVASYLAVPVVSRSGTVLGGLFFGHPEEGVFGQREESIAVGLAAQAAVAMDNARLFESVRKSEERYRTIVDTANEGVWLLGADSKTTYANQRMVQMLGYAEEEMLGRRLFDFMDEEACVEAERYLERHEQGVEEDYDFRFRRKDGSDLWAIVSTSPLVDENGEYQGALGMVTDITERKRMEEQLAHQALHDPLTDLSNRVLFMDRLEQALARASRSKNLVAILFMDLDNFKIINDSLGHLIGDRLLVAVAERLQPCVRAEDTIARLGGDEFAILLEEVQEGDTAIRVAQRIVEELQEPFVLHGQEVFVSTSIGIALSSRTFSDFNEGDGPEALVSKADTAMYKAKRQGKSRHAVFEEAMDYGALERLRLENDLRRALEREEFRVYYQPEISLEDGRIVGFEALVRWEHPERGLVFPGEFIPLAEANGLIVPIGLRVLEEACRQAREWHQNLGLEQPLMMSVNLSARQFEHPELAEDVARVLDETGADPFSLNLEITESVAMQDAPLTTKIMRELKALGVKISIDDFGTGYSSMGYLQRFPADYLKIDRSFVGQIGEGAEGTALVTGIVYLAHNLGMKTIGEGVETAEQLAKLREVGCNLAQGYYFSKPLPKTEAYALIERA